MADAQDLRDLEQQIDALGRARAARNERTLGVVRLISAVVVASVDTMSLFVPGLKLSPPVPWTFPLPTIGAAMFSALALGWLRWRGYHPAMAIVMPLLDASFVLVGVTNARVAIGAEAFASYGSDAVVAVACALVALTGTLRFTRTAVVASSVFAGGALSILVVPALPVAPILILSGLLAGFGVIGIEVVRSQREGLASEVARAALSRFLPAGVVQQAQDAPLSLLGPPREQDVAILVTDLRGFTAWSQSRTPAEVMAMLDEVQGRLAATVEAYRGVVDKFLGDGMLAVFPVVDDALAAAVEILTEAHARVADGRQPVAVGLGLHAGPVVLGALGSGRRLEFTVLGDTVNIASRLEGLTKEHGVPGLVSEDALSRCVVRPPGLSSVGEVEVRGRTGALRLWALGPRRAVSSGPEGTP